MPQMERNLDLESVDSDTLFGIEALKHQSIAQKIVFYGCLIVGVLSNILMPRLFHTPAAVNVLTFTGLIVFGITAGCNYTQDMSYGKYLFCMLFEKRKKLTFRPTEDMRFRKKVKGSKPSEKSGKGNA